MIEKYSNVADFTCVYIEEAHPTGVWEFVNNRYEMRQHADIEERINAATVFKEQIGVKCPILIDMITDDTNLAYGGLPERMVIIFNSTVRYIGGIGPYEYSIKEMEDALQTILAQK